MNTPIEEQSQLVSRRRAFDGQPHAAGAAGVDAAWFEPPAEDGIGRLVIDRPDDAVNALDVRLLEDLARAIRAARGQEGLRGLIVASAKPEHFMAGADLELVAAAADSHQLASASRRLQAVLDELAWLPCTTVAAINGPALGGGLEVALACDYRVALDAGHVVLGLPEVRLGLVPGGGGTQRLPRLIGLPAALDLILSGRRLDVRRARGLGLLDDVVHPTGLGRAARAWAGQPKRPLDRPLRLGLSTRAALDVAELVPAGRQLLYRQARSTVLGRTRGHFPAPLRAVDAIESGIELGLAAGMEVESQAFGELATTATAKNLIWLFMASQKHRRPALRAAAPTASGRFGNIGVVGAGFMGSAIAEVGAAVGLSVRVRDAQPEAVARGLARVRKMVDDDVARRRIRRREGNEIVQRISGTVDYSGFASRDLVVEAVFEDLDLKRAIIRELDEVLPEGSVIASNTSALPIEEIARNSRHADRVVGMHFFSPVERMPLVEVVRPRGAADWAVERAVTLGKTMGKTVIVVADLPGFYTSRVLGVMMNEAVVLLEEGARLTEIDRAMTEFGFPVGPFVLFDEVGLEVARHAGETMTRAFGDRIPRTSLVAHLVEAGQRGKRVGAGFYIWRDPARVPRPLRGLARRPERVPNPDVYRWCGSPVPRDIGIEAIQARLALLFVNEAIRCLEEGVLESASAGELGAVLGLGFPSFRGGPFHYADSLGLEALTARLHELAEQHGRRYAPADLLVERARDKRMFFQAWGDA